MIVSCYILLLRLTLVVYIYIYVYMCMRVCYLCLLIELEMGVDNEALVDTNSDRCSSNFKLFSFFLLSLFFGAKVSI